MVSDWNTLSYELLLQIMQQLPQEDRLRAGLCCSTWRAAANAATDSVQLLDCDESRALALVPWLQQHGPQITSLQIKLQEGMQLGKLPCDNLRELIVGDGSCIHLPLLPPAAATCLTKLSLRSWETPKLVAGTNPQVPARKQAAKELAALTQLQYLSLGLWGEHLNSDLTSRDVWGAVQHMQQLTYLELELDHIMRDCRARVSILTNLRVLILDEESPNKPGSEDAQLNGLQHLQRLTKLKIDGLHSSGVTAAGHLGVYRLSTSSLGRLTGLRSLHLRRCVFKPAVLSAITGLRTLVLVHVDVVPADLMSWLQHQQQSTRLWLQSRCFTGQPLPEEELAAFGAITASTGLRELDLSVRLPKASWLHVFPATRLLPELTSLRAPFAYGTASGALLDPAEASAMAQCCPALQALKAGDILRLEPQLSSLQHLTRLDVIRARLAPRDDRAAAWTLKALHRLRQLRLCDGPGKDITQLSKHMADALTQLTGLVRLELLRHNLNEQQLSSLCGLTRLTHLTFEPSQLGVLLQDRVEGLCGKFRRDVVLEFAPGKVPQDGPSELTQRLLECFTCNHKQVQQELTSLRQQVAHQQQQITQLTAHNSQLAGALEAATNRQRNSASTQLGSQALELQQQPSAPQCQRQQQEQMQRGRRQQQPWEAPQPKQQQQLLEWYEQKLAERDQEVLQLRQQLDSALQQQQHSQQQQHTWQQQLRQKQTQWAQKQKQWAQQQQQLAKQAAAVADQQQRLARQMAEWQAELLPAEQGQQQGVVRQLSAQGTQQTSAVPPPTAAAATRQALALGSAAGSREPMSASSDEDVPLRRRLHDDESTSDSDDDVPLGMRSRVRPSSCC